MTNAASRKNVLTKEFNIPETSAEVWLDYDSINNTAVFDLTELKPDYGIGGADLSSTTDLTAACILFQIIHRLNAETSPTSRSFSKTLSAK